MRHRTWAKHPCPWLKYEGPAPALAAWAPLEPLASGDTESTSSWPSETGRSPLDLTADPGEGPQKSLARAARAISASTPGLTPGTHVDTVCAAPWCCGGRVHGRRKTGLVAKLEHDNKLANSWLLSINQVVAYLQFISAPAGVSVDAFPLLGSDLLMRPHVRHSSAPKPSRSRCHRPGVAHAAALAVSLLSVPPSSLLRVFCGREWGGCFMWKRVRYTGIQRGALTKPCPELWVRGWGDSFRNPEAGPPTAQPTSTSPSLELLAGDATQAFSHSKSFKTRV